jgi:hypothetical protein
MSMNSREIAALVLSVLVSLPAAFAMDPARSTSSETSGVELTPAVPKPSPPQRSESAANADVDVRHCLELRTNREVIMCAEKYRSHKRKA